MNLSRVVLNSDLSGHHVCTILKDAKLKGFDLSEVILDGADLSNAKISSSSIDKCIAFVLHPHDETVLRWSAIIVVVDGVTILCAQSSVENINDGHFGKCRLGATLTGAPRPCCSNSLFDIAVVKCRCCDMWNGPV